MRSRTILIVSLIANLVLAASWMWTAQTRRLSRNMILPNGGDTPTVKTNLLVRKQFFTWEEVESDDYPTYIKNLREIGCPEQTVRDLIIADVNALYARKRAMEVVTPEQQWWRSEPDAAMTKEAVGKLTELELERRGVLASLLGTNWESGDLVNLPRPTRQGVPLDGPVLGVMPNDTKQAVQEISLRLQDRITAYTEAQRLAGRPVDPAELARMKQQMRTELTSVLSPTQLEEFLLRYSDGANTLRSELGQLKYFNATADEFRLMFRATDPFDQQLASLGTATDANTLALRRSIESQRALAIRNVLGADRFNQFALLHDSDFRTSYSTALANGTPESAATLFEINRASQEEFARIGALTNVLTPEQQAIELRRAEVEQAKGVARALGQSVPPAPEPPAPPQPQHTHVMLNGEGIDFLARLYGVEPSQLRAANPDVDFNRVRAGDTVNIPLVMVPVPVTPRPPSLIPTPREP